MPVTTAVRPTHLTIAAEGHARRVRELRSEIHSIADEVITAGKFHYGPQTARLETGLQEAWGGYPVATTSCTQALILALHASGIGSGHEVIVPSATFAATAFAVHAVGAVPVIVDVDDITLTLSPQALQAAITPHTRAVIPVHLHGHMADMPAINEIATAHDLTVIEDCAQAPGATLDGRAAGTWGDYGCFSFWVGKNIGGLEDAGAVITTTEERATNLRQLTNMGRDNTDRHTHHQPGSRARLGELNAGIVALELARLPGWIDRRNAIADHYNDAFANLPLATPQTKDGYRHAYYKYALGSTQLGDLSAYLAGHGIQAEQVYPYVLPDQPAFDAIEHRSHVTKRSLEATRRLCLPAYPELDDTEVEHITQTVTDFFTKK